jgi:hypothetical protein
MLILFQEVIHNHLIFHSKRQYSRLRSYIQNNIFDIIILYINLNIQYLDLSFHCPNYSMCGL